MWTGSNGLTERGTCTAFSGRTRPQHLRNNRESLGFWLTRTFAKTHSDEMFNLIAKHGMRLHQEFWDILGSTFASKGDIPWERQTLERWVSLLLATAPRQPSRYTLLWLGEHCIEEGLTDSLLDVFRMMSSPRLSIGPSTAAEVSQSHRHHELNELWEKGLKPNLNEVAEPLLDQLVDSFTARHRTLSVWQTTGSSWDPDSLRRSAIEPHDQDAYPESLDVLIDAARDSLEHLATTQPETAANWCDRHARSPVPILRRLAVHTTALRGDLTPQAKIDCILGKSGLHDQTAHHELFRIMRAIYPYAAPEQRQTIIEEVYKFNLPERDGQDTAGIIAYQHFLWFTWLSASDPDCDLVKQCISGILERYIGPGWHHHRGPTTRQAPVTPGPVLLWGRSLSTVHTWATA